MIFPEKQVVYVKIPKTGSTSVHRYFVALDTYSTIINLNHLHGVKRDPRCYRPGRWPLGAHVSAQDIKWFLKDEYPQYFKFTVVRNPFERLVSNYSWQRSKERGPLQFSEFVDTLERHPQTLTKQSQLHAIPQAYWITDEAGNLIVDYIARFENLETDFQAVLERLGLPQRKLGYRNASSHVHYSNYYDAGLRERVEKLYRTDLDLFGYKFEDSRDPHFVDAAPEANNESLWERMQARLKRNVRNWLRS